MGICCSRDFVKDDSSAVEVAGTTADKRDNPPPTRNGLFNQNTPATSFSSSPWQSTYPAGVAPSPSPARTPRRIFKWPFPPPSPAKPIMEAILNRQGKSKLKESPIPENEGAETETQLDKNFGYSQNIASKYELGNEVGRGHFGHTCSAKGKKGDMKNQPVAVKIISKAKMKTAISVEDVCREVKILKSLSGHKHLIKFHEAFEDSLNVYIVMELCKGGELLDRILSRGGRYTEEDAKPIVVQILTAIASCHLQGVIHRDLKPENFLFTTTEEDSPMKIIDFGLSDFIKPDQRLNDIVGSAYYVAPEVLHRSYSIEADMWSIGVITYILLCGSRPFWARTESGIFRSVLRADPNLVDPPWPSLSVNAKDFVKRLLNKDHRKRMSASQALTHPWLRDDKHEPVLDISIYKQVKSYVNSSPLKRAAIKALSKALTEEEHFYLKSQFMILEPNSGYISIDNFKKGLVKNLDIILNMEVLGKMDFEEFCAGGISVYQLEATEGWEDMVIKGFGYFEEEGNLVISVEELAKEMNLGPAAYNLMKDWIRRDGKMSFLGYTKFLHGVTVRANSGAIATRQ